TGNLDIQLSNRLYEKRSMVNFVINNSGSNEAIAGVFSLSVRKLEELEALPKYTSQNFPSLNTKESGILPVHLPELRGQLISGSILKDPDVEGDLELDNKIVAVSIPGDTFFLRLVKTDAKGR